MFAGSQLVWQYYPGPGHPGPVAGHLRPGQRRSSSRRAATTSCAPCSTRRWAWPPRAPAASPGSRSSTSTTARPRGSAASRRAPRSRPSRARRRAWTSRATSRPRAPRWGSSAPPPPRGRARGHPGRRALPAVLLRSRAAHPQRLHPGAQRALRLREPSPTTPRGARSSRPARREARVELPTFDTGALVAVPARPESDLGYHMLLRDFLRALCKRVARPGALLHRGRPVHRLPAPAAGARPEVDLRGWPAGPRSSSSP